MSVIVVTGSAGLVWSGRSPWPTSPNGGYDIVGIDNNLRERFFGADASTEWNRRALEARYAVRIVMADASDEPGDIVTYWRTLERGYECAFGTRFTRAARVVDYPPLKLALNRVANTVIAALFRIGYNDVTNAFKCYRREEIVGLAPILSHHFNITVELPLKAMARGYTWTVVPTDWYNRKHGVSKFEIKEMGSRYLFIVLYALIEKWLSRGDYRRAGTQQAAAPAPDTLR